MNIVYKILLLSILSFSLPIGRLFETFIWSDRIVRTEIVIQKRQLETRCHFIRVVNRIKKKIATSFQDRRFLKIIEKTNTTKTKQSEIIQKDRTNKFKNQLIRRYIFNITYTDDSENCMSYCF
jgi:hemerythrin superfamily protein